MDREWTDKRMDDFAKSVDHRFDQVDHRFDRFERSVDRRFDKVDHRFDRFERSIDRRFDQAEAAGKNRFTVADALEKERFAAVQDQLAAASKKTDRMIWTLIGAFVSTLATVIGKVLLG